MLIEDISTTKLSELDTIKEEFDKFANVDYRKLFYSQPTQIKKLKENYKFENKLKMENVQNVGDNNLNLPVVENNEENEMQLLNKKRKQSEAMNELKRELIEK